MLKRNFPMLLALATVIFLPGNAVAATRHAAADPRSGTVRTVLKRLRASGLCLPRREYGQGPTVCDTTLSDRVYISANPERLDARFEAITTMLTVENTDTRVSRHEVQRSTRIAVRLIRTLFPRWAHGPQWVTRMLARSRTSECLVVKHVDGYAISISSIWAADYNMTSADLVIARDDVAHKYQNDYCR